jgi:hypothetical protein
VSWLDWFRKKPRPLTGAPRVRRQKTHSAQSGYVYQYYYEGQRKGDGGMEFVFEVSADRKTSFPVAVRVPAEAVAAWERAHGRELIANEWYAIAKMALVAAFDERANPGAMAAPVDVSPESVEEILHTLDRD